MRSISIKIIDSDCAINLFKRMGSFDCAPYLSGYETIVTENVMAKPRRGSSYRGHPFDIHILSDEERASSHALIISSLQILNGISLISMGGPPSIVLNGVTILCRVSKHPSLASRSGHPCQSVLSCSPLCSPVCRILVVSSLERYIYWSIQS